MEGALGRTQAHAVSRQNSSPCTRLYSGRGRVRGRTRRARRDPPLTPALSGEYGSREDASLKADVMIHSTVILLLLVLVSSALAQDAAPSSPDLAWPPIAR